MNYKFVEVQTEQNIILNGFLAMKNNKKCVIYIPGYSGNFLESKFARTIGNNLTNNNYDFLFAHNQGSFQIIEYPFIKEDGKRSSVTKGAIYEEFNNSISDLNAWFEFLTSQNYSEIVVIAHSLGCNKIINYINEKPTNKIKKIILLAPQDNSNFSTLEIHKGMLEEAKKNIKDGFDNKILSRKLLGFSMISSRTYIDMMKNKSINNIPYKNKNGDFSKLSNISQTIYIIIGTKDIGENGVEYLERIKKNTKNSKYEIIEGANHNFKNKEQELSDLIKIWLTEN